MSDIEIIMPEPQPDTTDLQIPCEVYTRIVGYLRPVQAFNAGKRQEFEDRVVFNVGKDAG